MNKNTYLTKEQTTNIITYMVEVIDFSQIYPNFLNITKNEQISFIQQYIDNLINNAHVSYMNRKDLMDKGLDFYHFLNSIITLLSISQTLDVKIVVEKL